jgi:putative drug exporter of the RND superfamily
MPMMPSLMHLFGDANWLLPRWLDRRLPHLAIEPAAMPGTALRSQASSCPTDRYGH